MGRDTRWNRVTDVRLIEGDVFAGPPYKTGENVT